MAGPKRTGDECPECDGWGTRWEDAFAEYERRVAMGHLPPDAPVADVFQFKCVPACPVCGGHGFGSLPPEPKATTP